MHVVCVTIHVKPEHVGEFIDATYENCRGARSEPGNVHFHFLQAKDDPNRFFIYEAYKEPDDFKKHQQTPHYLAWKETVAGWMAQPRQGVKHANLYPPDSEW
jgi:autoinducer 2-degrading protein